MVPVVVIGPPVMPVPVFICVTVPLPPPVLEMVIFPVEPLIVIPLPAASDKTPVLFRVTTGVIPPPLNPVPAITCVIPEDELPLVADVILPKESTVRFVFVYEPEVTPELARDTVPDVVIGPPTIPDPVNTLVTVPEPVPLVFISCCKVYPAAAVSALVLSLVIVSSTS